MSVTVDSVVATYIKLRNKKAEIQAEVKDKIAGINASLGKIEAWLKEQADKEGVTSFKTKSGTAFLTTDTFAGVADWDALLDFILKNEQYDMLEKRVSKLAVVDYVAQHSEVPPGVNLTTKVGINVRKPSPGAE